MSAVAQKKKWYVIWRGRETGIFRTWDQCKERTDGFPRARFKSFKSEAEAVKAFTRGPAMATVPNTRKARKSSQRFNPDQNPIRKASTRTGKRQDKRPKQLTLGLDFKPEPNALVVDGACCLQTGDFEYQAVWLHDKRTAFKSPVLSPGTNNLAEFLGLVAGLRHVAELGLQCPVYSDSQTAISWVRKRAHKCGPVLQGLVTDEVAKMMDDAINWLKANPEHPKVIQWMTKHWGENPADYGRKS